MAQRRRQRRADSTEGRRYEVELITGLERFVDDELGETLGRRAYRLTGYPKEGRMSIRYSGPAERLLGLRSAVAVHLVERFDIPRPKALLGHEYFSRLVTTIRGVIGLHAAGTFRTFRVSAAGSESTIMKRLRSEIGAAIRLDEQTGEGHLNLSIRRSVSGGGWEALVRLTPMPLSARAWRVCNRPDALNATVAHAMIKLPGHSESDRFVNVGMRLGDAARRATSRRACYVARGDGYRPGGAIVFWAKSGRGRRAAGCRFDSLRHSLPTPARRCFRRGSSRSAVWDARRH